jgi:hypothetical protein
MRALLSAGVAALFVASSVDTADAQGQIRRAKPAVKSQTKKDVAIRHPFGENMPKGVLQLVVSIADQRITLYSDGKKVAQAPVSTGTPGHPTPFGIFSIIQKNRWHRSNLYGNAPMWYMHRLTWSGIALHEGVLPGRPASHGCIRLSADFVSRLWSISKMGMRVVVSPREVTYEEFSHAKLFNPKEKPADPAPSASRAPERLRSSLDAGAPESTQGQAMLIRVAQTVEATADGATASDAAPVQAPAAAAPLPAEPPAPAAVTTDDTRVPMPPPAFAAPVTAPAPAAAAAAVTPARVAAPGQAEPDKPAIDPEDVQLPRPAPLRTRSAEPGRTAGQVAVFVSRREKKIFVRQGFVPVFDMPIEIADINRPIGTHLYTAMQITDNGTKMRWNALTMAHTVPPGSPVTNTKAGSKAKAPPPKNKKNAKEAPKPAPKVEVPRASNATEALDRITIPQEAIDRISEVLIPGSSLIISDEGLGRETGRYTEFIVVTR